MQRSRRLVTVDGAEFRETQRQLTIRAQAVLEDLHMAGAVHRFQRVNAMVLGFGLLAGRAAHEHALAVPTPVAGDFPQVLVKHLWRIDLLIVGGEAPAHVGTRVWNKVQPFGCQKIEPGPSSWVWKRSITRASLR